MTNNTKTKKYSITFDSIEIANNWLSTQNSIVITNLNVSSDTKFALLSNNIVITQIYIEFLSYPYPVNNAYGIDEMQSGAMYISADIQKLRQKWSTKNPDKQYIFGVKKTTKRHLMGSGIGFISFVKDKLVVLYKR